MAGPGVTVLIPTHDHGPTLYHSVRSALGQTVGEIEVLVVGDGVPDTTREIVAELMREDERVRFLDNPKGPNRGEVHRHAALQHAQGDIVCYLPDDDLWLPDHVATVQALLREAEFVHTLPIWVGADGAVGTWNVDLALPFFREMLQSGANRVPFGCGAHTLAMYRQVPGWRTTPEGSFRDLTDLHMWQQFLAHPECRVVSSPRPTAVTFPSPERSGWTMAQRLEELARWSQKLGDPVGREEFLLEVLASEASERAQMEVRAGALQVHANAVSERVRVLDEELGSIHRLPSWRLRKWLLRWPPLEPINRWVGRALASRGAR
ncbi:MAG: glycosyltransferase family 2 protein [Chloroflexi bacterium]|nr:glycosyltransferase family 2 protein [Chloroflexota bacterium]